MYNKYRIRAKITEVTDPGQGARLATKEDFQIFESRRCARETAIAMANVYTDMERRIQEESSRKYPNKEYIQRCRAIQEQHRKHYEEMLAKEN